VDGVVRPLGHIDQRFAISAGIPSYLGVHDLCGGGVDVTASLAATGRHCIAARPQWRASRGGTRSAADLSRRTGGRARCGYELQYMAAHRWGARASLRTIVVRDAAVAKFL